MHHHTVILRPAGLAERTRVPRWRPGRLVHPAAQPHAQLPDHAALHAGGSLSSVSTSV